MIIILIKIKIVIIIIIIIVKQYKPITHTSIDFTLSSLLSYRCHNNNNNNNNNTNNKNNNLIFFMTSYTNVNFHTC